MATHSSILAWRILCTEEPVVLQCMVLQIVTTEPLSMHKFCVVVQFLSSIQLFVIPWTAAHYASMFSLSPEVCSNPCPLSQ